MKKVELRIVCGDEDWWLEIKKGARKKSICLDVPEDTKLIELLADAAKEGSEKGGEA